MDIFNDTSTTLELERFKAKIREIWSRMLDESYDQIHDEEDEDCPSREEFMLMNALKFADEPQEETEIDSLMNMLDGLMDKDEELESVQSEGKAPKYGTSNLKSNNEQGKKETTTYEYKHTTTKTPSESHSGIKGGSYMGTPSSQIGKAKNDKVTIKYSPLIEQIKDELKDLASRQKIGRRKLRFRL
jgi:hypothetical protein